MDKKGFEALNDILGFEITDKRLGIIDANVEKFKTKIPYLLETPDDQIKNTIGHLLYIISNICWSQGIYFSSLQKINKSQATQESFSHFQIPVFDFSNLGFIHIQQMTKALRSESADETKLASYSLDFGVLDETEILVQLSRIATSALLQNIKGPLFLQANELKFGEQRFENDRENLLEELKKKTKQAIQLGLFNINYDASQLLDADVARISDKMLMNLKMVAMATNLWVRNFQPNGVVVSVSGKMGMGDGSLPPENDLKEYLQRLVKEGSRLRFGVAGEDISKVEIQVPKLDSAMVNQLNQLNQVIRRDIKLGGLVIDVGEIKSMNEFTFFSGLKICEIKMKLEKDIITEKNIQTIMTKCGVIKLKFNPNDYALRLNQLPKAADY